jgi:hypothetical protein
MSKFGTKETWMEPMNRFLATATPEFKKFIDDICAISSSQATITMEPQYATPTQIRGRLPVASREGLPSLPYLLDTSKLLSALTELWTAHAPSNFAEETDLDDALKDFHTMCADLQARTKELFSAAEQAEKPDGKLEPKWQQVIKEQQQKLKTIYDDRQTAPPVTQDPELTALPQPHSERRNGYAEGEATPPATQSAGWERRVPFHSANARTLTDSTNSSTASFEVVDDSRARMSSRDGPGKTTRIFDSMFSSTRRKGRADHHRAYAHEDHD